LEEKAVGSELADVADEYLEEKAVGSELADVADEYPAADVLELVQSELASKFSLPPPDRHVAEALKGAVINFEDADAFHDFESWLSQTAEAKGQVLRQQDATEFLQIYFFKLFPRVAARFNFSVRSVTMCQCKSELNSGRPGDLYPDDMDCADWSSTLLSSSPKAFFPLSWAVQSEQVLYRCSYCLPSGGNTVQTKTTTVEPSSIDTNALWLTLNRNAFSHRDTSSVELPIAIQVPMSSDRWVLSCVLMHSGPGLESGHYTLYAKSSTGTWSLLNDSTITLKEPPKASRNVYAALFVRESSGQFAFRHETEVHQLVLQTQAKGKAEQQAKQFLQSTQPLGKDCSRAVDASRSLDFEWHRPLQPSQRNSTTLSQCLVRLFQFCEERHKCLEKHGQSNPHRYHGGVARRYTSLCHILSLKSSKLLSSTFRSTLGHLKAYFQRMQSLFDELRATGVLDCIEQRITERSGRLSFLQGGLWFDQTVDSLTARFAGKFNIERNDDHGSPWQQLRAVILDHLIWIRAGGLAGCTAFACNINYSFSTGLDLHDHETSVLGMQGLAYSNVTGSDQSICRLLGDRIFQKMFPDRAVLNDTDDDSEDDDILPESDEASAVDGGELIVLTADGQVAIIPVQDGDCAILNGAERVHSSRRVCSVSEAMSNVRICLVLWRDLNVFNQVFKPPTLLSRSQLARYHVPECSFQLHSEDFDAGVLSKISTGNYLNDAIMNAKLRSLISDSKLLEVGFLSSYLCQTAWRDDDEWVESRRQWLPPLLNHYQAFLFAINAEQCHWQLGVVCNLRGASPRFFLLDSLAHDGAQARPRSRGRQQHQQSDPPSQWATELGERLSRLFDKTLAVSTPRVPQQTNASDCGLFVLEYAKALLLDDGGRPPVAQNNLQSVQIESCLFERVNPGEVESKGRQQLLEFFLTVGGVQFPRRQQQ
jgi:hypothetical protein